MTPEEKRARQREYRKKWEAKAREQKSYCPCGGAAVAITNNCPVCANCLETELWFAQRESALPREVGLSEHAVHLPEIHFS